MHGSRDSIGKSNDTDMHCMWRSGSKFRYRGLINAKVAPKSNNARNDNELMHFGRAQERTIKEFFAFHRQPNFSGDDMNIIQVGRSAVSRFHQQRGFTKSGSCSWVAPSTTNSRRSTHLPAFTAARGPFFNVVGFILYNYYFLERLYYIYI